MDRDGTLIHDLHYAREASDVRLLQGVGEGLRRLKSAGFSLVLVSNQSGVGRGFITLDDVQTVHTRLLALLREERIELDAAYYCLHAPANSCECRKPRPGLFLKAAQELNITLQESFVVGDQGIDVEAGFMAGCKTILIGKTNNLILRVLPDHYAADWQSVADFITQECLG